MYTHTYRQGLNIVFGQIQLSKFHTGKITIQKLCACLLEDQTKSVEVVLSNMTVF